MAIANMAREVAIAGALCLVAAGVASAHEHHSDNIAEGEVVSPEPLVCLALSIS